MIGRLKTIYAVLVILFFNFLLMLMLPIPAYSITLSGPITATSVVVTGDVTVSSMTASTVTVSNALNVLGTTSGMTGRVLQMHYSSTTLTMLDDGTTNFSPVDSLSQTVSLHHSANVWRLTLSGCLGYTAGGGAGLYITIFRDSNNLGDAQFGLAAADVTSISYSGTSAPISSAILDSPGDTSAHTYKVYFRDSVGGNTGGFPYKSTGYFVLEEIGY